MSEQAVPNALLAVSGQYDDLSVKVAQALT